MEENELELSDLQKRMHQYGQLHYTEAQIMACENLDNIALIYLWQNDSMAKDLYYTAKAKAKFALDMQVLNLALNGDIDAIKMHQERIIKDEMNEY
jgi:hypothetical protein